MGKQLSSSQDITDWITSNRLYEDNLFYYVLIIVVWFFIGFFTLGFEINGFSLQQNLGLNFIWYLILCLGMAMCSFWYRLFFSKTDNQKRIGIVQQKIDEIDDEIERTAILDYMVNDGQLPMRPAQRWALVFLGCYFLFEIFYISAWVKDLTLVWQPDWVLSIIEWTKNNTTTPPLNIDRKLFMLEITDKVFKDTNFKTEQEFMNSSYGHTVLFYRVIRSSNFIFLMASLIIIFWKMLDWLGIERIDPRYIDGIGKFFWVSLITFFMFLFIFGGVLWGVMIIEAIIPYLQNKFKWLSLFWENIIYIFILFAIKILTGWWFFWRNIILTHIKE